MTELEDRESCPECRQPLIPGNDVCWVCYVQQTEGRWPDADSQRPVIPPLEPQRQSSGPRVVRTIVGTLLVALASGAAAVLVFVSMMMAFVGAILSAFFEICTGMKN